MLSNFIKETAHTGPDLYFSQRMLLMYGTNCFIQLTLDRYHCSCTVFAVWTYLATCLYNFSVFYVYNGLYVFGFIALYWAAFSALYD